MIEEPTRLHAIVRGKPKGNKIMMKEGRGNDSSFNPSLPGTHPTIPSAPNQYQSLSGRETLLVIEDDDAVREFTVRTLKTFGYHVLSASDGQTALELFKNQASRIHMVITDILMPKMTGKQFVEALRQFNQDVKIMFVSGYDPDHTADEMPVGHKVAFLEKPFGREQLWKKIRDVLDHEPL